MVLVYFDFPRRVVYDLHGFYEYIRKFVLDSS